MWESQLTMVRTSHFLGMIRPFLKVRECSIAGLDCQREAELSLSDIMSLQEILNQLSWE